MQKGENRQRIKGNYETSKQTGILSKTKKKKETKIDRQK